MHNNLLLANPAGDEKLYVEDVFSTWLYTGNSSTQTITNGIDLAGKGGLFWLKRRSGGSGNWSDNWVFDSTRAGGLRTNLTNSNFDAYPNNPVFNSDGVTLGAYQPFNESTTNYASWTFRKAAKFFDIVTWTGNGSNRTISHALGVVPGLIIVKRTDTTGDWQVYHRSLANTEYMVLNTSATKATGTTRWNSTTPTATVFSLGTDVTVNANGGTYVAYLFAHDDSPDGIIKCGIANGAGGSVNLGWEPQFVLNKVLGNVVWGISDNMRGIPTPSTGNTPYSNNLSPNLTAAENTSGTAGVHIILNSLGFSPNTDTIGGNDYIYVAIRRGPMRTPTSGTSVFSPNATNGTTTITTNFPVDALFSAYRSGGYAFNIPVWDRLRGGSAALNTSSTGDEITSATYGATFDSNTTTLEKWWASTLATANWSFRRAPGFFDIVCYTGTGSARTVSHNLGVAPELYFIKNRSTTSNWRVSGALFVDPTSSYFTFNSANPLATGVTNALQLPTTTTIGIGSAYPNDVSWNQSGNNYVAYLFASCPGVSKVGSYTGNGSSQNIDCGFTNGARFVLIKRTDASGDWYVWDTARGIVAANDPHLSLNSTAAEVTTNDTIDPLSTGFTVNQVADTNVNVNAATYIYLAIA